MKKQAIMIIGIIIISINLKAQVSEKILSVGKNLAYFDSICVYQNLVPTKQLNERTFVTQIKDTLFINDLKLIVKSDDRFNYQEENSYRMTYICVDDKNNYYHFTIYYAYGHSYQACLIVENTDMRYGFCHNDL